MLGGHTPVRQIKRPVNALMLPAKRRTLVRHINAHTCHTPVAVCRTCQPHARQSLHAKAATRWCRTGSDTRHCSSSGAPRVDGSGSCQFKRAVSPNGLGAQAPTVQVPQCVITTTACFETPQTNRHHTPLHMHSLHSLVALRQPRQVLLALLGPVQPIPYNQPF